MSAGSGPRPRDYDAEPELGVHELRLASVHATGKIFRWHVVARKDLTVGELLRAVVTRSQATVAPLQLESVILAEVMNSRLHRTFEHDARLERLRRDDFLVVYEVAPPADCESSTPLGEVQNIACHMRLLRDPEDSYFIDDGEVRSDLLGIPLMFSVRSRMPQGHIWQRAAEHLYGAQWCQASSSGSKPPFELYHCKQARALTSGGARLDPESREPVVFAPSVVERTAALFVAEWPAGAELPPWVTMQVAGSLTDLPECYLQLIVGVDVCDLVKQVRSLREDRTALREEVAHLRKCLGRYSVQTARADSRAIEAGMDTTASAWHPSSSGAGSAATTAGWGTGSLMSPGTPRREPEARLGLATPSRTCQNAGLQTACNSQWRVSRPATSACLTGRRVIRNSGFAHLNSQEPRPALSEELQVSMLAR